MQQHIVEREYIIEPIRNLVIRKRDYHHLHFDIVTITMVVKTVDHDASTVTRCAGSAVHLDGAHACGNAVILRSRGLQRHTVDVSREGDQFTDV
jgi:hypothetical protein